MGNVGSMALCLVIFSLQLCFLSSLKKIKNVVDDDIRLPIEPTTFDPHISPQKLYFQTALKRIFHNLGRVSGINECLANLLGMVGVPGFNHRINVRHFNHCFVEKTLMTNFKYIATRFANDLG